MYATWCLHALEIPKFKCVCVYVCSAISYPPGRPLCQHNDASCCLCTCYFIIAIMNILYEIIASFLLPLSFPGTAKKYY